VAWISVDMPGAIRSRRHFLNSWEIHVVRWILSGGYCKHSK
jgi:hypothetical protein